MGRRRAGSGQEKGWQEEGQKLVRGLPKAFGNPPTNFLFYSFQLLALLLPTFGPPPTNLDVVLKTKPCPYRYYRTSCCAAMASTTFVSTVSRPELSLVVPLLVRGFRERGAELTPMIRKCQPQSPN